MFKLTDIYNSDSAPSFASAILAVGASALFSIGLLLILNSHNNAQTKKLQQTIAAIQKSQTEGTDINTALAEIQASNDQKYVGKSSSSSVGGSSNIENITVKNATNLQGNVKVGGDLEVAGRTSTKGDTTVGGTFTTRGDSIVNGELGVTGTTTMHGDSIVEGSSELQGDVTISGTTSLEDLTINGALTFSSELNLDSDLTVGGAVNAADLQIDGTSLSDLYLSTEDAFTLESITGQSISPSDITLGLGDSTVALTVEDDSCNLLPTQTCTHNHMLVVDGGLVVSGPTILQGTLDVSEAETTLGNVHVTGDTVVVIDNGLNVGGDFNSDGDINGKSITTSGKADFGDDLTVNGNITVGVLTTGSYPSQDAPNPANSSLRVYGDLNLGGGGYDITYDPDLIGTPNNFNNVANWNATGWTTTASDAKHNSGNATSLSTNNVSVNGTNWGYHVTYTISGATKGTVTVTLGHKEIEATSSNHNIDGVYYTTIPVNPADCSNPSPPAGCPIEGVILTGLVFTPSVDFDGTISDVSLKAVTAVNPSTSGNINLSTNGSINLSTGGAINLGNPDLGDLVSIDTTVGFSLENVLRFTGPTVVDGALSTSGNFNVGSPNAWDAGHTTYSDNTADVAINGDVTIGILGQQDENGGPILSTVTINGDLDVTGTITTDKFHTNTFIDVAENYPSHQALSAGDVVTIDPGESEHVLKSSAANDDMLLGVVSTNPGLTLGSKIPGYPIALAGRVPVKVTDEGGPIAAGDYLTSSSIPGYAKKAVFGNKTIGQALSSLSGSSGTVIVFVNVSKGTSAISLLQSTGAITNGSSATLTGLNISGPSTLSDLAVSGSATINTLTVTGATTVATITVNGHIIGNDDTRGSVTVPKGKTTIHHDFTTPYGKKPAVVASPTGDPVQYSINPTATGFDINLSTTATNDTPFDYLVQE